MASSSEVAAVVFWTQGGCRGCCTRGLVVEYWIVHARRMRYRAGRCVVSGLLGRNAMSCRRVENVGGRSQEDSAG
jgi:hypothetical protein